MSKNKKIILIYNLIALPFFFLTALFYILALLGIRLYIFGHMVGWFIWLFPAIGIILELTMLFSLSKIKKTLNFVVQVVMYGIVITLGTGICMVGVIAVITSDTKQIQLDSLNETLVIDSGFDYYESYIDDNNLVFVKYNRVYKKTSFCTVRAADVILVDDTRMPLITNNDSTIIKYNNGFSIESKGGNIVYIQYRNERFYQVESLNDIK